MNRDAHGWFLAMRVYPNQVVRGSLPFTLGLREWLGGVLRVPDGVPVSLTYWCTKAMTMLPSPTAAATRFSRLKRTSPHANMLGTFVSRR